MDRVTEVGVGVFRPNQTDDEIELEITVPVTGSQPRRRLTLSLTPAAFALALTGRGGIKARLREYTFPVAKKRPNAKE